MTFTDSTDRFTVPEGGLYIVMFTISGSITTSSQSGDGVQILLRRNGSSIAGGNGYITTMGSASGDEFAFHDSYIVQASANDCLFQCIRKR